MAKMFEKSDSTLGKISIKLRIQKHSSIFNELGFVKNK